MDLRYLAKLYKSEMDLLARERRQHPPQEILVPMKFPLSIPKVKSEILEVKKDDWVVRQVKEKSWKGHILHPFDVSQMRKDFLSLKHQKSELLTFLNKYGWWGSDEPIPVSDFWELQELILTALCLGPKGRGQLLSRRMFKGLPGPLSVQFVASFQYEDGKPKFVIETEGCMHALVASVQIDLAQERKYRHCARPGCEEIFEVKKREKTHHSPHCQTLHAMQRYRDRKRQRMAKIKGRKARVE
jgi:hypothetical protein